MATIPARDQKVKAAVRKRDNLTCQKCGRREGELHVHHIKPLDEGGADTVENCLLLCRSCHLEWESVYKAIPFDKWMTLPPAALLLAAFLNDAAWLPGMTAQEWREGMVHTASVMRQIRQAEARKGEPEYEPADSLDELLGR